MRLRSRPGYRALLVTPIHRKERLYGYLALFYAEPHRFKRKGIRNSPTSRPTGHLGAG